MRLRNTTPEARDRARKLRRDLMDTERKLWARLRRHATGFHFRRQHPLGPYTLDFFCHEARLAVELDGECHEDQAERDARRDAWIAEQGLLTLRVPSLEFCDHPDAVIVEIYRLCVERSGREGIVEPSARTIDP